ncbi:beta-lactamase domain-containing protein 2-like isoform X2 [Pomacea canaliculata]|nr:beta-lactamase domain-containing protein 2-like isoform X2 [Pomacea canaliculata]XP_025112325.1 beta-lactamase domain-containing protein 2-like isoform X2 [Pomacea canaliculata]
MAASTLKVPAADGFVKPGFEHVQDVFRQTIEEGIERGGSFAAYFQGELVVNLWGGFADEEARRPWKYNTASVFYSTTKSPSAVVIGHLVDRGYLDYEQPISRYWPEYGQNGKEKTTLKQLLSLKSGVPVLSDPFKLSLIRDDPQQLESILAQQTPWKMGDEFYAYSPVAIGLYLDQIVRKVDPLKRNLSQYFQEEIAKPFGVDFHIGISKPAYWRVARPVVTVRGQAYKKYIQQMAANPDLDINLLLLSQSQPIDFQRNSLIHDPDFMELPVGSTHGVGSAEGMAKLHGILANGGLLRGQCLLSAQTLKLMQTPLSMGTEKHFGQEMFYSYGMTLLPVLEGNEVKYNFGHGGFGGQFAASDVQHKTGWAYVTNYLDPTIMVTGNCKWQKLEEALFKCVQKVKGINLPRKHILSARDLQNTLKSSL